MDEQQELPAHNAMSSINKEQPNQPRRNTSEVPAPASDQTNPHNQEPAGDWQANERAADRKNNEPGMTDEERKRRRW
ncbi:MAG TPA: hypothetical protein VMF69_22470 [Gemmataceae bacterium]|nr:hypothetical protein [Gemmataceae bacterium]